MTLRDKIMDKYWLEFLRDINGDMSTQKAEGNDFWWWFYNEKVLKGASAKMEDYL